MNYVFCKYLLQVCACLLTLLMPSIFHDQRNATPNVLRWFSLFTRTTSFSKAGIYKWNFWDKGIFISILTGTAKLFSNTHITLQLPVVQYISIYLAPHPYQYLELTNFLTCTTLMCEMVVPCFNLHFTDCSRYKSYVYIFSLMVSAFPLSSRTLPFTLK